jgi:hypothetical protein
VIIIKPERGWSILPYLSLFVVRALREKREGVTKEKSWKSNTQGYVGS